MLNFEASKPRVKGGPGPRGPPWIRTCWLDQRFHGTCIILSISVTEKEAPVFFLLKQTARLTSIPKWIALDKGHWWEIHGKLYIILQTRKKKATFAQMQLHSIESVVDPSTRLKVIWTKHHAGIL